MSDYIMRQCPICNKFYQADPKRLKYGRQTTCSRECSYIYRGQKKTKTEIRPCDYCGQNIERVPSHFNDTNFCSVDCLDAYRYENAKNPKPREQSKCLVCKSDFLPNNRSGRIQKYCSRQCFETAHKENMRGKNNPAYIDGRNATRTYNVGEEWHKIRMRVYKRDNFTCQCCGVKCISKNKAMRTGEDTDKIIQCHHIESYDINQDNSLDNLTTLCISCHRTIHNMETKDD